MSTCELTVIDRGTVRADMNYVVDGYAMGSASEPNPDHEYADFGSWSLVIETPDATVLWDTGSHPEAEDGYWPAPLYEAFAHVDADEHDLQTDLEQNGYALSDIDAVVQSHLHLDHAGGLYHFDGTDVPVYVHADELKYAYYSANTDGGSIAYLQSDFDRDLNWRLVYGAREQHFGGLEFLHLPGHTPGVIGAKLELADETVLVAGDEAYVDANYRDGVPLGPGLLDDGVAWRESRRWLQDIERRHDVETVIYGHDREQLDVLSERY
jgi:glyoxylase-like metal-dependent hydrolase (beta-lactamase superfamily II)